MPADARSYRTWPAVLTGCTMVFVEPHLAGAEVAQPTRTLISQLTDNGQIGLIAHIAILATCALITVGGLWVFHRRQNTSPAPWGPVSVQTLGTIFFFPTLILLAVYLELPKDAITTILGAFLGYLFGRSSNPGSRGDASDTPTAVPQSPPLSQGPPGSRPASVAERRTPEVEPAGSPAPAGPAPSPAFEPVRTAATEDSPAVPTSASPIVPPRAAPSPNPVPPRPPIQRTHSA